MRWLLPARHRAAHTAAGHWHSPSPRTRRPAIVESPRRLRWRCESQAKMLLLTPFFMVIVFGSMLITRKSDVGDLGRTLLAFGAMAMTLLSFVQLVGNQFGFDRGGFRVFVLCPAPRRDILLGKNLAVAPIASQPGGTAALITWATAPTDRSDS